MANNTPAPSTDSLLPTVQSWLQDMNTRFAPNRYGDIDDTDFREVFTGLSQVFANWGNLNVKRVKGATYPVPYTDNLSLIPPAYRILGMQAEAVNGVDSGTGATGARGNPVYYELRRDSYGTVDALLDAEPATVLTVKARWVQISGTEEEQAATFPGWVEEDHPYDAGDVFQYTFEDLVPPVTRLFEVIDDLNLSQNPRPTGLDDDDFYKPFAPLTSLGASNQVQDSLSPDAHDKAPSVNAVNGAVAQLQAAIKATQLQGAIVRVGGVATPFATYAEAEASAAEGDDIYLTGYHSSLLVTRSVNVHGGSVGYLLVGYPGGVPVTATVSDTTATGRIVVCQPSYGDNHVVFDGIKTSGTTFFEQFGLQSGGTGICFVTVRNTHLRNAAPYLAPVNGTTANGCLRFQERTTSSQWVLENSEFESVNGAVVTGYPGAATRVELRGTTVLSAGGGHALQEGQVINTGVPIADAAFFIDTRGATGAPGDAERFDLFTIQGYRTNTLVIEGKATFSSPVAGPNIASVSAQVIKAASGALAAVSAPRTGTIAQIVDALNADIAGLSDADAALLYVRVITVPVTSAEEAHLLLTITQA